MIAWGFASVRAERGGRAVLSAVTLSIREGEKVVLVGPSGSGKSTLARVGLGLAPVAGGRITLLGRDATGWGAAAWRRARQEAQLLLQDPLATLHPDLPVADSLLESAALHPGPGSPARRVAEALGAVGLSDVGFRLPRTLSGGERRRASLARVCLARPRLLVCDEPTAGLDQPLQAGIARALWAAAPTVVAITHDPQPFLAQADRVVVFAEGEVLEDLGAAAAPSTPLGRALLERA